MKNKTPKKMGRPTKYKPEFCEMLIEHMTKGFSFESFAAQCDSHFDSLYEWCKIYPEFSEAKKKGTAKSLMIWESIGINGTAGKLKNFNTASWIFNMKNRFKWRDRVDEFDDTTDEGSKKIRVAYELKRVD